MDAIDDAIKKNYHINSMPELQAKTWQDFERESFGKKVYLLGAGIGIECYFNKLKYMTVNTKGGWIVDNDNKMYGLPVDLFSTCIPIDYFTKSTIASLAELEGISTQNSIFLITSLKRYVEIALELKKLGIYKFFSLLCMEYVYRSNNADHVCLNRYTLQEIFVKRLEKYDIIPNKIFIETYYTYEGHGKAILKRLNEIRHDLEIVWAGKWNFRSLDISNLRYITKDNFYRLMYETATAKIILTDGIPSCWDMKKTDQIFVEMKHWSSITLKEFYWYEYRDKLPYDELEVEKEKYGTLDYIMVGSEFDEKTCREGFLFDGPSIYVGSPRSDVLFNGEPSIIKKIYGISSQKVLLYAPTFRLYEDNWKRNWDSVEIFIDLNFVNAKKVFENKFGGEWVIFLRLHPIFSDQKKNLSLPKYVIDVSDYPDSEELVMASDAMIADYSSIMFEPAFVKKPVFLLSTDLDDYLSRERSFLLDYKSLPFPVAKSNEKLEENIMNFDQNVYEKKLATFFTKYGINEDGHASKRAARFIIDLMDGKVHKGEARDRFDYAYGIDTRRFS